MAITVSVLSLGVSVYCAYITKVGVNANVAAVRPILAPKVADLVRDGDVITLSINLENIGKSSASISRLSLIYGTVPSETYGGKPVDYRLDFHDAVGDIIRSGEKRLNSIVFNNFQDMRGSMVDILKQGRIRVEVVYAGIELSDEFSEQVVFSNLKPRAPQLQKNPTPN